MARIRLKVEGFQDLLQTIDKVGGNVGKTAESALIESQKLITSQVNQEIASYKVNTGELKESLIDDAKVRWLGMKASILAGFDQDKSMHATYMMITGTRTVKPNKKLYNAIYGAKTKKKIAEIQIEALEKAIEEAMR